MWSKLAATRHTTFFGEVAIILGTLAFMIFLGVMSPVILAQQTVKDVGDGLSAIFNPATYEFTFRDNSGRTVSTISAKTQWPTSGTTDNGIRGFYATRYYNGRTIPHNGIDISNAAGTPIYSFMDGTVIRAGVFSSACGNWCLIIDHGGGITTLYAHMRSLSVKTGDRVQRGQQVGEMGSEGFSTGPHLHFEVRFNGKHVDPRRFLKGLPPQ